ncbi:MAG TPA: Stk1 family PASTA domain-containing Ser/Thr kinase [Solirubrobacteraceae bacterium]|jgi:serine/threonine-protein kinase
MNFQIAAGTMIDGRYRVVSRVGSGGMAEVYCAEDTQLGRRVAVKLLHERFAQDAEFVERFRREASSAASLSHANIVNVYDRGEWGGTYYIAMEFLDGRSLDSVVREDAPLPADQAIELTEQVLRAARFAHRRDVVHRDLKPHNVIIDDEGRVKVTDFGIARAGASEITQTGSIMGTARYLSPEQAQGQTVGARSDLYAVGIMLYELLTGTVPFEGESVVAIALRHLSEPPRPPSTIVPSISPNLDAIVMRALEKDPERRFADADEFLAALEGERERLRREEGSHTAALAPLAPVSVLPGPAYPHPASYNTQPIGPIGPATGVYGTAPAYWDPNTTGIIPPGSIVLPPGSRERRPVWPWVLFGLVILAAAIAAVAIVLLRDRSPKVVQVSVPYVVGLSKADAQATLTDDSLKYTESLSSSQRAAGTVIAQVPGHETKVAKNSNVAITISTGPPKPRSKQVPNVIGLGTKDAFHALHTSGFRISPIKQASTTVPKNDVISTNPSVGSSTAKGSTVVVTISTGPPRVAVPNVVNETVTSATLLLQQRGFVVHPVPRTSTEPAGTVLAQTPSSGKAAQGSVVTLSVAKAPAPVVLPRLLGLSEHAASLRLVKLGLVPSPELDVRHKNPQYDGDVISQQPPADSSVPAGSTVVIGVESYVAPATPVTPVGPTGSSGSSGATGPTTT